MSPDHLRAELLTLLAGRGYGAGPSGRIVHLELGVAIAVGTSGVDVSRQARRLFTTSAGGALDIAGRIVRKVAEDPTLDLDVGVVITPKPDKRGVSSRIVAVHKVPGWPVPLDVFDLVDAETGRPRASLSARAIEARFTWDPAAAAIPPNRQESPPMHRDDLPPRADDVEPPEATDTDTDTDPDAIDPITGRSDRMMTDIVSELRGETAEDPSDDCGILPEVSDAARVGNYVMIAERDVPAAELAEEVTWHRGWMRENNVGDPMVAASRRIQGQRDAGSAPKVIEIARIVYAAVQVREEGREGLAQAPTIDSIGGDIRPDTGKKKRGGRGKGKGKGPQGRRAIRWLGQLGRTVTHFKLGFGPDNERIVEVLAGSWFTWDPKEIRKDPVYGWCDLGKPMDTEPCSAVPSIGGDPEYVVWGLRCDSKASGCPSKRFQIEADQEALEEAVSKGYAAPTSARVKDLFDQKRSAWYADATPTTTVIPVSLHRPTFTVTVHTGDAKAVEAAEKLLQAAFGNADRVQSAVRAAPTAGIAPISLRHPDLYAEGGARLAEDFLVWLLCRRPEVDTSVSSMRTVKLPDLTVVEWWPDDAVELVRAAKDDDKRITVKVGGAPEEGAVLAAAIASGAVPKRATIAIRHTDRQWRVTVENGEGNAWKLPCEVKIGRGTPEELDACVDERLRLLAVGRSMLGALMDAFLVARADFQQLGHLYRKSIKAELGRQLELFTGLTPVGGQAKLGDVIVKDERTGRGGRRNKEAA